MDITFNCSNCGQHIAIDEAGAGMSIQCPKCAASITVPDKSHGGSVPVSPNPQSTNLQDCPDCGRQISRRAVSCPHCGAPIVSQVRSVSSPPLKPVPVVTARSGVADGMRIGCGFIVVCVLAGLVFAAINGMLNPITILVVLLGVVVVAMKFMSMGRKAMERDRNKTGT